jgi:hypothetical protein
MHFLCTMNSTIRATQSGVVAFVLAGIILVSGCGESVLPQMPEPVQTANPSFADMKPDLTPSQVQTYFSSLKNPDCLSRRFDSSDIYVLDSTNGAVRRIGSTAVDEKYPAISDDGQRIVFCYGTVYVLYLKTMKCVEVLDDLNSYTDTRWVPHSDNISFRGPNGSISGTEGKSSFVAPCYDIYVVDEDGANLKNLTNTTDTSEYGYDWSPNGAQLAYVERQPHSDDKYKVWIQSQSDPSDRRLAVESPRPFSKVAWGVDERKLFCSLYEGESDWRLGTIDIESGTIETFPVSIRNSFAWDVSHKDGSLAFGKRWSDDTSTSGIASAFETSFSVHGENPNWCNSGRYLAFVRRSWPEGFVENLKMGISPDRFIVHQF